MLPSHRFHVRATRACAVPLATAVLALTVVQSAARAQDTQRVNVSSAGAEANANSLAYGISADGRYVCFQSSASNLVPGDTNFWRDVFVRDLVSSTTERVSVATSGAQGDSASIAGSISADGRYVSFTSLASNFVADANLSSDVFVHDRVTGATVCASVTPTGATGNRLSGDAQISADGRYVVFSSHAFDLAAAPDDSLRDIFVRDLVLQHTTKVSYALGGGLGDGHADVPAISADGRYVVFRSAATNLVAGDTNNKSDVFRHDLQTGATMRVNVDPSGLEGNEAYLVFSAPSISNDGRFVAFESASTNLVPGDTNGWTDVFVRDVLLGVTTRVSVASNGTQSDERSTSPRIRGDGRFVVFASRASNLAPGDIHGIFHVFVHDRLTGATTRESVSTSGDVAHGDSSRPDISADGRLVTFLSTASHLVPSDTNDQPDVFLRDRFGRPADVVTCAGDGTATACPCSNGAPFHGCAHSVSATGAFLSSNGFASVAADTFELLSGSLPATTSVLYFQGTSIAGGGAGVTFGDGLRCANGVVRRIGTKSSVAGASSYGRPAGDVPVSVRGSIPAAGGDFVYQVSFRNSDPSFCTPATFNLTSALRVTWIP